HWTAPVDGPNGVKRGQIFRALARLKPGVTATQAAAEGSARAAAAPDAGPVAMALFGAGAPIRITVTDANEAATADVRPAIIILLMASVLLFASAIGNVANMQVARATARQRELTIRAALGAGMGRLSRQLLIENAMIGLAGAGVGLLLSIALHRVMPSLLPADFPRADAIAIDGRVLAFTVVLSLVASLAACVLPVLHARRLDLARALSDGSLASAGPGRGRMATMRLLIVGTQVAVTSVLVIGGVLLTRSFLANIAADRGYDPSNVITATVPFPGDYTFERRQQARNQIVERLAARPGITHVAFSTGVPLMSAGGYSTFTMTSPFGSGGQVQAEAIRRVVTPGYFGALGVRVRAGRPITDADVAGSPTSVVVNRSFVRKYLDDVPIERAVGVSLGPKAISGATPAGDTVIVGVADDLRQDAVSAPDQSEMYVAMAQMTAAASQGSSSIVVVRTGGDPASYVETLRTVIRQVDPAIALDAVMTMDQRVGQSVSRPRTYAVLLAGFALAALLIAGAGLYGVLSHGVAQRSRELAVRSALGASRPAVVAVALKQVSIAMILGVATGIALSTALASNLAPFLYGVPAGDWISFAAGPALLLAAGVLACAAPARRVARTDPIQVLRDGV
ncbi:MAG: FtsX-like permease family protein, partial [Vicinamibacterales bacterium]